MKIFKGLILGLCLLAPMSKSMASEAEKNLEDNIKQAVFDTVDGKLHYQVYINTITGPSNVEISMANSENLPAASTIKVFIGLSLSDMVENGEISYTGEIKKDLDLALRFSDNEATNRLIDRLGGFSKINSYIKKFTGSDNTRLNRKMLAISKENLADPRDLSRAMAEVYKADTEVKKDMEKSLRNSSSKRVKLLKDTRDFYSINKTGELIGVENDTALVDTGKSCFSISLLTKNDDFMKKEDQLGLINELGIKVFKAYEDYEKAYLEENMKKKKDFESSLTSSEKKLAYGTYESLITAEASKKLLDLDLDPSFKAELIRSVNKSEGLTDKSMAYLKEKSEDAIKTKDDEIVNLIRLIFTNEDSIERLNYDLTLAFYENIIATRSSRLLLEKSPRTSLSIRESLLSNIRKSDGLIERVLEIGLAKRD